MSAISEICAIGRKNKKKAQCNSNDKRDNNKSTENNMQEKNNEDWFFLLEIINTRIKVL